MPISYKKLGESELEVSNICLGTMTFGEQNTESQAHQQLDYATDQGINFIDTAEMYPLPKSEKTVYSTEKFVGSWLKNKPRDQIILASKPTGGSRGVDWVRDGNLAYNKNNLRQALEGSLKRLKTDYLDLYQLHWPERNTPMFGQYLFNPEHECEFTPIVEVLEALSGFIDEGKVRYIGLSNEWPWGVMKYLEAAKVHNLPRVVSVQNAYSLINRTFDSALREVSYRENIPLLAYSPLGFGHLSAKYVRDPKARGRVNIFDGLAQRYEKPMVEPAVKAYAKLADELGISPTTLALSFVYSRWFCASTIIGATTMEQLRENIKAVNFQWSDELEKAIEEIHLRFFNPAP